MTRGRSERDHAGECISDAVIEVCHQHLFAALCMFSARDIPGDFRCTYDLAVGIPDRRDRQRNVNQAAILAPANSFIILDPLTATDTLKNSAFLRVAV